MTRRTLLRLLASPNAFPLESPRLRVAVVQMSLAPSLEQNRDRILDWIAKAAERKARVVVFPEGALSSRPGDRTQDVPAAARAISRAARKHRVYVLYGGWTWSESAGRFTNWMKVLSPEGRQLLHYDKIWELHDVPLPGLFELDGVPAAAIICADRWLRGAEELPIQAGARISFELSNNYAEEWLPEIPWHWYVPRALRNGVFVVFANTANAAAGKPEPGTGLTPRHGHSVVIAPDGAVVAAARDDSPALIVADIDVSMATRAEALARRRHPALSGFWETGLSVYAGKRIAPEPFEPLECPETDLTVAVAQPGPAGEIGELIREAADKGADLVAFPVLSGPTALLEEISRSASRHKITVVFGHRDRAYAIGPQGQLLTRHRQLTAGGARLSTMLFHVKGVPAALSAGRDALWNEIAELAAVAGARIHVNVAAEPVPDEKALLRRRRIATALASFRTLTLMANRTHSAIWGDLTARAEIRSVLRGVPRPDIGPVRIYSAFSANLIAEAGRGRSLLLVHRRIPGPNPHYPTRVRRFHPPSAPWFARTALQMLGRHPAAAR